MIPHEVMEYIEQLADHLDEGKTTYMNCPQCKKQNKLSISRVDGIILFNCFSDQCNLKGKLRGSITIDALRNKLDKKSSREYNFNADQHFSVITRSKDALEWLARNNSLEAWSAGRVNIKYDPKLHTVAFLRENDEGRVIDAAGRFLRRSPAWDNRKWHKYGNSGVGLIVPHNMGRVMNEVAILEDAASACAVSNYMDAYALLGTHLTDEMLLELWTKWPGAFLILDPDAQIKALRLANRLSQGMGVRVKSLPDDPKNINLEELGQLLAGWKRDW